MPTFPGDRMGPYQILAAIGAGGMGEVYQARDTRLDRIVAIKISKVEFSERFEREARAVAALNHSNICTLYDVGPNYLVMEYIEGPTLAGRIHDGAIPLAEALPIARQIAEALEAAHDKGIVHRDLKPANIKLTPEGKVKVLDFGLAKAFDKDSGAGDPTSSPTLTISPTRTGVILGTAAYMSPEQARGHVVDRRADIWAYGVVLFEMLTGHHTFAGETISDTLAAVLKTEPDWSALPVDTPPAIRRLLRRCLQRDRKQRLPDIAVARMEIDEPAESAPAVALVPPPKPSLLPWALAALLLGATVWIALVAIRAAPPEPSVQSSILPPEKAAFTSALGSRGGIAISPDGRTLAFVATQDGKTLLWVRRLDSLTARSLPGTENAYYPFWSPDNRSLGFFANAKLKRMEVAGGPAQVICDASAGRGASWNPEGTIIFSLTRGMFRVPAAGGQAVRISDPASGEIGYWPEFLPDGRHFLYSKLLSGMSGLIRAGTIDQASGPNPPMELLQAESNAMYAPGPGRVGWLLFARQGTLFAQGFDAAKRKIQGEPVAVAERVAYFSGFAGFSVSQTGALVYAQEIGVNGRLIWLNREGKPSPVAAPPGSYQHPRLSPDGTRLAVSMSDALGNADIWQIDLAHEGVATRFTFDPAPDTFPVWSPDGKRIAFRSVRAEAAGIYLKAANGTGNEEPISPHVDSLAAYDWSRDGRYILRVDVGPSTGTDLWVYDLKDLKSSPLVQTPASESQGQFSPDGRWVAYSSDESGRFEVYVRNFGGQPFKSQISANGGGQARWRGDGKELYYLTPEGKMIAVTVKTGADSFETEAPRVLFEARALAGNPGGSGSQGYFYDVTRDGQRFLIIDRTPEANIQPFTLITNWQAGLRR